MKNKKIVKYAGITILSSALISGIGLGIHDKYIDHTQEVCPITTLMNSIPNLSNYMFGTHLPTGVAFHQWPKMKIDYVKKGINDVQISYGKITEEDDVYGLKSTWGETSYDYENNEVIHENESVLKIKK